MESLFEMNVDCEIYTTRMKQIGNIKSKSMRQPVNVAVAIVKALLIIIKSFYLWYKLYPNPFTLYNKFLFKMIIEDSRSIFFVCAKQIFPT